jgi:hypothetical protein
MQINVIQNIEEIQTIEKQAAQTFERCGSVHPS